MTVITDGTVTGTSGSPDTMSNPRTLMPAGYLATGIPGVEGMSGLRVTGTTNLKFLQYTGRAMFDGTPVYISKQVIIVE
jgi:hypothetical protein